MIEYLYDAIRATAGQDITITAEITNDEGEQLTEACHLMLYGIDKESLITTVNGEYFEEDSEWRFTIPGEATKGLSGRYWYCICYHDINLCFKEPIYLVQGVKKWL